MSLKETDVIELYLGLFGEAPTKEVLESLLSAEDKVAALESLEIADVTEEQSNEDFINSIYLNLFNYTSEEPTDANEAGIAYWVARLEEEGDGNSRAEILAEITESAKIHEPKEENEANLSFLNSSVEEIAADLGVELPEEPEEPEVPSIEGEEFTLKVGQDNLKGTDDNDIFYANVVQNDHGAQTNTLGTGDVIKGGAGNDTLKATVQAASSLNAGPSAAIRPTTESVENIEITGLSAQGLGQSVNIDAAELKGVSKIGSVQSNVDVNIFNMTTRTNESGNGVKDEDYTNRKVTESVTINYDHSAPDVDLTVLFDNDYLVCGADLSSQAHFWLLDQDAELQIKTGQKPNKWPDRELENDERLADININGLRFNLDGKEYTLEMTDEQRAESTTHEAYISVLQTILKEKQAAGEIPTDLTLELDTVNTHNNVALEGGLIANPVPSFALKSASSVVEYIGFVNSSNAPGDFDVFGRGGDASTSECRITSSIELEKVGRDGDGGVLTVGGMAGALDNSLALGVEVFNILVKGDKTQNSSLAGIQSTHNTLEEVNVSSAAGSEAKLFIGNTNTIGGAKLAEYSDVNGRITDALLDVKTFNATGFNNDLELNAALTNNVVKKYFNLKDSFPSNVANDNVNFNYDLGQGNDTLNLEISKDNFNFAGTTTREDFVLNVNTGAGNDKILVNLVGDNNTNWYNNSELNSRLNIDAGTGNDTITTKGGGNFKVEAGSGNDTIYLNDVESKAAWVVGAVDGGNTNDDLESAGRSNAYSVKVSFQGFEKTVSVPNYNSSNENLKANPVASQQLIKDAINNDPVLNKLLEAKDGPANTVVIESLIAGQFNAADLVIELDRTDNNAYVSAGTQIIDGKNGSIALNANESDNLILMGAGQDVTVLSTNVASNDVLKFQGYGNGRDSIVHFDDTDGPAADSLDFNNYLTSRDGNDKLILTSVNDGTANSVNGMTFVETQEDSFSSLNGTKLLALLNGTEVAANSGTLSGGFVPAGKGEFIAMVENANNPGEYKIFHLTGVESGKFSSAQEITTADFGYTINLNNAINQTQGTAPVDPVDPQPEFDDVITLTGEAGESYSAAEGAIKFIVDFNHLPGAFALTSISGFGDDDFIEVINAPVDQAIESSANPDTLALWLSKDYNDIAADSWAIVLNGLDPELVTEVVAVGNNNVDGFEARSDVLQTGLETEDNSGWISITA